MHLAPIVLLGTAYLFLGRRRRKKKLKVVDESPKQLPLPPADFSVYAFPDMPDLIRATVGDLFAIQLEENRSIGEMWDLVASPVDNSIELESQRFEAEEMPGAYGAHTFILKASKPGRGALVFHYQDPSMAGKAPPQEILEIQTEIL